MDFRPAPRRRPGESIVPMINVVFLLLIFFLMTAQFTPSEPFDVTVPQTSAGTTSTAEDTLYISASGVVHFQGLQGTAVFDALRAQSPDTPLRLRADARLPAQDLARIMRTLAAQGLGQVELVVIAP